jgi:TRAP transporter solute receptor, TAXI family
VAAATVLLVALSLLCNVAAARDPISITIATGRVGGLYHPIGGAICALVNEKRDELGITCTIEITAHAVNNIRALRDHSVDLALAQSDWQYEATKGIGAYADAGPFPELRSMFAPYVEQFTVVARRDKGIDTFDELKGKRIYMGPEGSGRRQTMQFLMEAHGWAPDDITDIAELNSANEAISLCENEFDAFIDTIGHPNHLVREAADTCDVTLVPIQGSVIDKLIDQKPFYTALTIPAGTYRGVGRDVPGLGLPATVVTTAAVPPEVAYEITKAFFENIERLREGSAVFSSLSEKQMTETGLAAPLHEGARAYFIESGLMKK